MNDDDFAGAIAVGVGVFFGGAAMRGPARVADAVGAFERILADDFFEIAQFSRRAAEVKLSVGANDSDAGGIVAAIFELSQTFNNDRDNLFRADVAHDTAHLLRS